MSAKRRFATRSPGRSPAVFVFIELFESKRRVMSRSTPTLLAARPSGPCALESVLDQKGVGPFQAGARRGIGGGPRVQREAP